MYIIRGDFKALFARLKYYNNEAQNEIFLATTSNKSLKIGVLTPPHTLFIANMFAKRLNYHGLDADIFVGNDDIKNFNLDFYFVLCPQVFSNLPPGEKRIVYQLEQAVSTRWFNKKYLDLLENSLAVLDYNLFNIKYLQTQGIQYPHVYLLPIGANASLIRLRQSTPEYDIIFYGDSNSSPRRRLMLEALSQKFKVLVVNNEFGESVYKRITNARVVINLHYYEQALLEAPRIQECLSLGMTVVSETAQNQKEYPQFNGVVSYFTEGSIDEMLYAVSQALAEPALPECIKKSVNQSEANFNFMFDRMLLSTKIVAAKNMRNIKPPISNKNDFICLSLPETIQRREALLADGYKNLELFDGLRYSPGWQGCALSYKYLAKHAIENNLIPYTIMEDDALLPDNFLPQYEEIKNYLASRPDDWDVFAGLIASLHSDVKILSVERVQGRLFVTINKMTSMVFNIYNRRVMHILKDWNIENSDDNTNTIDRMLEARGDIRIIVALPFFAQHKEQLQSTLWGFKNTQYTKLISNTEEKLTSMVNDYLATSVISAHTPL
jgi:hypothetical protein